MIWRTQNSLLASSKSRERSPRSSVLRYSVWSRTDLLLNRRSEVGHFGAIPCITARLRVTLVTLLHVRITSLYTGVRGQACLARLARNVCVELEMERRKMQSRDCACS